MYIKKIVCDLSTKPRRRAGACYIGVWAWLTSITLSVIDRQSKNVGQQFREMLTTFMSPTFFVSATNVANIFVSVNGR